MSEGPRWSWEQGWSTAGWYGPQVVSFWPSRGGTSVLCPHFSLAHLGAVVSGVSICLVCDSGIVILATCVIQFQLPA